MLLDTYGDVVRRTVQAVRCGQMTGCVVELCSQSVGATAVLLCVHADPEQEGLAEEKEEQKKKTGRILHADAVHD